MLHDNLDYQSFMINKIYNLVIIILLLINNIVNQGID